MDLSSNIKQEALEFIKKNNTAVVATTVGGDAHASAVHYVADDELNIYFLAHRNTGKYLSVSPGKRAAIVIGTGPKHISIQASGLLDLSVGQGSEEVSKKFKWLKGSHLIEHWPIEEMADYEGKDPILFKFEPLKMTFMNLDDDDYPHSKGKDYHLIVP